MKETAVEWLIENTAMSNDIWADEIEQAKSWKLILTPTKKQNLLVLRN